MRKAEPCDYDGATNPPAEVLDPGATVPRNTDLTVKDAFVLTRFFDHKIFRMVALRARGITIIYLDPVYRGWGAGM